MNTKRTTIIFLATLVILVLGLAIIITRPFLQPFAFAVILAVVFFPVHERVLRAFKKRRGLASLISTLAVMLLFGVPAFIIVTLGANEALSAAHYLTRRSAEEGSYGFFFLLNLAGRAAALHRALGRSVQVRCPWHHQLQRAEGERRPGRCGRGSVEQSCALRY